MSKKNMVNFKNEEKREIDFLRLSLKSMRRRFSTQKNFRKNSNLLFRELYKVLNYEDEYLVHEAFTAYEQVKQVVKSQTFVDNSAEVFLFTLEAFMQRFFKETSKLFD